MSTALQTACEQIERRFGIERAADSVVRTGVKRRAITLELDIEGVPRWFQWRDGRAQEHRPEEDVALPDARELIAAGANALAYRPGRRLVVLRRSAGGEHIVKAFRRARADAAADRHEHARATGAFVTARLRARTSSHLDFERLDGVPLDLAAAGPDVLTDIGARLRRLQSGESATLELFSASTELEVLDGWCARAAWACGALPTDWQATRAHVERAHAALPEAELGPCHRDLHDGQFLLTADGVALLDFDLLARADRALDPGNLIAHFLLRTLQAPRHFDEASATRCRAALLRGLARGDVHFQTRLRFYEATALLRLALVYALRPRWAALAPALVARARAAVEEVPA